MTELDVFKVSMRFTSKIKKVAVSPKRSQVFLVVFLCSGQPSKLNFSFGGHLATTSRGGQRIL